MKKFVMILLILSMTLSLGACGRLNLPPLPEFPLSTPSPSVEPTPDSLEIAAPEETEEPNMAEEDALPARVIVTFQEHAEEVRDPARGEFVILTFSYVTPVVYIEGRDLPAAMINEYIAMLDETFYTGNDYGDGTGTGGFNYMLEIAEDNFTYIWDNQLISSTLEYSSTRDVRVERADEQVLNLVFNFYEFTGGAHGNYADKAYVFNTESGERVTLDQLTENYADLADYLVSAMLEQAENDERLAGNYISEEDRPDAFRSLLREGAWYFDADGLVLFSDPYEIGPYAAGIIDFHIPYADLAGRIDEKWLPAEKSGDGSFTILPLDQVEEGSVVFLDRVSLNENARELCLLANGTVYDVILSQAIYADQFYVGDPIWTCSFMTDCALQLGAVISEGLPNLMLRYRTADGELHTWLISESGLDGSPLLVEDTFSTES